MKICACCKKSKSPGDFTKASGRKDGLNSYCRECTRAKSKAFALANPEKVRRAGAKWYQANKMRRYARVREWFAENPGKAAEYCARWREKNPGKGNELSRAWYAKNRSAALAADKQARQNNLEKFLARERAGYAKRAARRKQTAIEWRAKNKDRVAFYAASRRSALAKRTPEWLTDVELEQMQAFFWLAAFESAATGVLHHVDHIVPLRGKKVSGLNVPWNLQIIPAVENLKKSNRHEP